MPREQVAAAVFFAPAVSVSELRERFADQDIFWARLDGTEALRDLDASVPVVLLLDSLYLTQSGKELWDALAHRQEAPSPAIVVVGDGRAKAPPGFPPCRRVPEGADTDTLYEAVAGALCQARLEQRAQRLEGDLEFKTREMEALKRIGIALSAERDLERLLELILQKSREITQADGGSLYLVEGPAEGKQQLRFMLSQNDSLDVGYKQFTMPITAESIAGYVALTGEALSLPDVYELPPDVPYHFNRAFDDRVGYRSKSMLVIPMNNHRDEHIGVIQLINRKKNPEVKLLSHEIVEQQVEPFDAHAEELAGSLASQAAVAIENNVLYKSIENLFEGFVKASVKAIESRDPPTRGHSQRVAILTIGLAERINRIKQGKYRHTYFTPEQLKELRYASLLHDFGKIGVREHVLLKGKKMYHPTLVNLLQRWQLVRWDTLRRFSLEEVRLFFTGGPAALLEAGRELDARDVAELEKLSEDLKVILAANEPTYLEAAVSDRLADIANRRFRDFDGTEHALLEPEELELLRIPKGTLNEAERRMIESHVSSSFQFLCQIPWPSELPDISNIVYAHHEKLDGTGYPRGLKADEIPLGAKMMAIADIYDALTASDRPYKPKVPVDRALKILQEEVNKNFIDGELLNIFIRESLYKLVHDWKE